MFPLHPGPMEKPFQRCGPGEGAPTALFPALHQDFGDASSGSDLPRLRPDAPALQLSPFLRVDLPGCGKGKIPKSSKSGGWRVVGQ